MVPIGPIKHILAHQCRFLPFLLNYHSIRPIILSSDNADALRRGFELAFTFFFRDMQILELIVKHALPELAGRSRIRVWDAGCAMGQETYSLAIMLAENMGHFSFGNVQIYATDVEENTSFGETVRSGVYNDEDLKRIPPALLEKYFVPLDGGARFRAVDGIRARITYTRHDLLSLQSVGEGFSLVLCKNVLLHFQQPERVKVIKMFHESLIAGGYFATEQTQKMPDEAQCSFVKVAPDGQIFRKTGEGYQGRD
jgi:chemotaxis protein methyltransferase CheR